MTNSINSNLSASYAQVNIANAQNLASASVQRLSSGNVIVQASDNVTALATGTSLQTQTSALNTALTNVSQGSSLLQVANGALTQVTSILQRQQAIALQAGSGSLTNTDRTYLNQEFQALSAQIDQISGSTNFNGVNLVDGSLSTTATVASNTTAAANSSASVNITALAATKTLILNGVTLTFTAAAPAAAGNIQVGGSISQTIDNAVTYLNGLGSNNGVTALSTANAALLTGATYSRSGNSLVITSKAGGNLSQNFTINSAALGTATATVNGLGSQGLAQVTGFDATTIDAAAAATAPTAGQLDAASPLTFGGVTVATLANGDSLRTIENKVNALTGSTGVSAFITGTSGAYILNLASTTSTAGVATADAGTSGASIVFGVTVASTINSLAGGGTTGLGEGSVTGAGSTGGVTSILTDQTQAAASSVISFPSIASSALTSAANFGNATPQTITIAGQVFTFNQTASTSASQTDIAVGATLQQTIDNAVSAINNFAGAAATNYAFNQISAQRVGNTIVISNNQAGNALTNAGAAITVAANLPAGSSVSAANLSGTSNTGINTNGVTNAAFTGIISGFNASYVSPNVANLSVAVGGITYSASNVTTNPTANTVVRMSSSNGGYFDMTLRANEGMTVNNSADAATLGKKLDSAFSGVTFSQNRDLTSYNPTGALLGSSVTVQNSDFSNLKLQGVTVTAPTGSQTDGTISFNINGDTYTSQSALGTQLGANSITTFVSATNPNQTLTFKNGSTALDFSSSTAATTLQNQLQTALGVTAGASSLSFQIGAGANDTLAVAIGSASTSSLFGGQTLDVLSQASAATASTTLTTALSTLTTMTSSLGALEERFNYATATLTSAQQNESAAASSLLDTNVATESTNYATNQVKMQAGISVLAQANQQLQLLLKLIQ